MTLFKIEVRLLLRSFLIWSVLFSVVMLFFAAFYPQIANEGMASNLDTVMKSFSPELLKAFNMSGRTAATDITTPQGYFAYYFQYMFLAASIYGMLLGTSSLIKEETDGTIEFIYAQPVTRKGIVLSKLTANWLTLSVFWLISFGASYLGFVLFHMEGDDLKDIFSNMVKIFAGDYLILLFFLALGVLISVVIKSGKQASGISLGAVFGFYLLGIFSDLSEDFSFLKNFSPIHMGIPSRLIEEGLDHIWPISLLAVLLAVIAIVLYERKDLKV